MNVLSRIVVCALLTVLAVMADPPWRPAHASGPSQVYTITPCRVMDTRFAGGIIPAGGSRNFSVVGNLVNQGGQATCGIPSGAQAVFLNVVVVTPTGPGYLTVYPWPGPAPVASTLNFATNQTVANGALTPICGSVTTACTSDLMVTVSQASAHTVVDVTGYLMSATAASTGGGSTGGGSSCTPLTCASAGAACGQLSDGCGRTLTCGTCTAPLTCGGGGVANACGDPNAFGWFKIVSPFVWKASNGPMPIQIGAMIDDGTPQNRYTGTVTVSIGAPTLGTLLTLYDSNMNPLPGFRTTAFAAGGWSGYVWLKTSTGQTKDISLQAVDSAIGVGGNSNITTWTVP